MRKISFCATLCIFNQNLCRIRLVFEHIYSLHSRAAVTKIKVYNAYIMDIFGETHPSTPSPPPTMLF